MGQFSPFHFGAVEELLYKNLSQIQEVLTKIEPAYESRRNYASTQLDI